MDTREAFDNTSFSLLKPWRLRLISRVRQLVKKEHIPPKKNKLMLNS